MPENKERYTSGPWKFHENPCCVMDAEGIPLVIVAGSDHDEIFANARLIAEAPAMFPLLKQYLKQHAEMHGGADCTCLDCKAARRIIARVLREE